MDYHGDLFLYNVCLGSNKNILLLLLLLMSHCLVSQNEHRTYAEQHNDLFVNVINVVVPSMYDLFVNAINLAMCDFYKD